MNDKRICYVLLSLLILPFSAFSPARAGEAPIRAQGDQPGMQGPGKGDYGDGFLLMIEKRLQLTPEQKAKVKAVVDQGRPKRLELETEMHKLHEKMRAFMRNESEKIREILTAEQKEKFDSLRVRMREGMTQGGYRKGGPRPGASREGPPRQEPSRMQKHDPMQEGLQHDPSRFPPEMWQEKQGSGDKPAQN